MPEGPEIYALSLALKKSGINAESYGKHLYLIDSKEDWSFGLTGKIHIDLDNNLTKINSGFSGSIKRANDIQELIKNDKLGINFMDANKDQFNCIIEVWQNSRKKLGAFLLDQSEIAGIGVAWGSEILAIAGDLRPDISANKQDLSKLSEAMMTIRDYIKHLYNSYVNMHNPHNVINEWFSNLYDIRSMNVYKQGKIVSTGGRSWWIKMID
jgi:formamidopyrimidine-DNA glycosylase